LITVSRPEPELRDVVDAFRQGGGADKPMYLKVQLSYAREPQEAVAGAFDQWRASVFDSAIQTRLASPQEFERAAEFVTPDDLFEHVRISSDLNEHADWIRGGSARLDGARHGGRVREGREAANHVRHPRPGGPGGTGTRPFRGLPPVPARAGRQQGRRAVPTGDLRRGAHLGLRIGAARSSPG